MIQVIAEFESEVMENLLKLNPEASHQFMDALKEGMAAAPEAQAFNIEIRDAFVRVKDA